MYGVAPAFAPRTRASPPERLLGPGRANFGPGGAYHVVMLPDVLPPPTASPGRRSRGARALAIALAVVLATVGCRTGVNYLEPTAPRYGDGLAGPVPESAWPDTLLVVTYNVQESREVGRALDVLHSESELAAPDIVLLQEMDARGTERVARALGMAWVYYPAVRRTGTGRDFGNAVLSRWPIVDDAKLILPKIATWGRMQRTATVVTVDVGGVPVRVYSVHLGTPLSLSLQDRRAQLRAVLDDASVHPRVILGGDLNSGDLGDMAVRRGFVWPTEEGPRTTTFGRFDHVLFRGLGAPESGATGTILDGRGASDHRPVWARGFLR